MLNRIALLKRGDAFSAGIAEAVGAQGYTGLHTASPNHCQSVSSALIPLRITCQPYCTPSVRLRYDMALAVQAVRDVRAALGAGRECEAVMAVRKDWDVGEHPGDRLLLE